MRKSTIFLLFAVALCVGTVAARSASGPALQPEHHDDPHHDANNEQHAPVDEHHAEQEHHADAHDSHDAHADGHADAHADGHDSHDSHDAHDAHADSHDSHDAHADSHDAHPADAHAAAEAAETKAAEEDEKKHHAAEEAKHHAEEQEEHAAEEKADKADAHPVAHEESVNEAACAALAKVLPSVDVSQCVTSGEACEKHDEKDKCVGDSENNCHWSEAGGNILDQGKAKIVNLFSSHRNRVLGCFGDAVGAMVAHHAKDHFVLDISPEPPALPE